MKKLAVASLVAAALTASGAASAAERVKFDFWYGLTGLLGETIARHCALFNQSQDKYEAVCTGQGGYDKAEQNTIAAYRAKQQPALTQIYDAGTVNFMLSGAVYPAARFAKDYDIKIDWSDYFPAIADYFATSKGELWSFPYNNSTALMYYNKDALEKIGKTAPPATLEELTEDLKAMRAAGLGCGYAIDFDPWMNLEQPSYIHGWPLATKNNGYDGLDAELVFNTTKAVDLVKLEKAWLDSGAATIMTRQTGKGIVEAFADGTCQVMITSVADHSTVTKTQKEGLRWGTAPIPVFAGTQRLNSAIGGASLWVMAGKPKETYEAVAAFLRYVTDPETGVNYIARNTGYIPVTRTAFKLLEEQGFYKDPAHAGREVAIASLTASAVTPLSRGVRLGNYTAIRAAFQSELQAILTGRKEVQAGFDDAVKAGNEILRRYEQTFKGKTLP
ncbi:extracellular solute-binding protein [Methylobacterium sp. JK268]